MITDGGLTGGRGARNMVWSRPSHRVKIAARSTFGSELRFGKRCELLIRIGDLQQDLLVGRIARLIRHLTALRRALSPVRWVINQGRTHGSSTTHTNASSA